MSSRTGYSSIEFDSIQTLPGLVLLGLSFGTYAISQAAITAAELSHPTEAGTPVLLSSGSGGSGAAATQGAGMGTIMLNHFAGAPVFAVFVVAVAALLTWRWNSAVLGAITSVVLYVTVFAGAVDITAYGTIVSPLAYFGAAVLMGLLYGGFGVGGGIVARFLK
jgi:hypothetical protein